jgi:hypothetical protein
LPPNVDVAQWPPANFYIKCMVLKLLGGHLFAPRTCRLLALTRNSLVRCTCPLLG